MLITRYCLTIFLTLLSCTAVFAQEVSTEDDTPSGYLVGYRLSSFKIETDFGDNEAAVSEIEAYIEQNLQDEGLSIVGVQFTGSASPDGGVKLNEKLAIKRRASLEKLVRGKIHIPDSLVSYNDVLIPWDQLSSQIKASDISHKDEIIEIIDKDYGTLSDSESSDRRIADLMAFRGGDPWKELKTSSLFSSMRNASVLFITFKEPDLALEDIPDEPLEFEELAIDDEPLSVEQMEVPDIWHRYLTLKTNAIGWGMAIANLGVEIDLGRHWSFTLPIYFSTWDYFKSDIKFNTFAIQPEVRYWFSVKDQCNNGWFAGAHFGMAYYNLAAGGDYRYQDCSRETPALGGGLALGYRMPIGKKNHWRVEFTLGGGCYKLEYDKFYNVKNGLLVESGIEKTYWGLDMAAVTFSYSFRLDKKGGAR